MNSIVFSYDKTDWRPDYYAMQDSDVAHNIYAQLSYDYDLWHNISPDHILISNLVDDLFLPPRDVIVFRLDVDSHMRGKRDLNITFSPDCFERVCDGYTITYSCIQLAAYMGCTEIYLLGVDCNYTRTNHHAFGFSPKEETLNSIDTQGEAMAQNMTAAYRVAREYAESHGITIFNATRGGKLEVFPRISLEEALKD